MLPVTPRGNEADVPVPLLQCGRRPWAQLSVTSRWNVLIPPEGKRRKANGNGDEEPLAMVEPEPEAIRKAKRRWAELLRRIVEVDPPACPRCGETMRIVSFITEPKTIDRILEHLRRTKTSHRRQRAPPRRWKSAASAASGYVHFRATYLACVKPNSYTGLSLVQRTSTKFSVVSGPGSQWMRNTKSRLARKWELTTLLKVEPNL